MSTTPSERVSDVARRWRLDINTVADPGTGYEQCLGIEEWKHVIELRTTSDEVYEDGGADSEEVTGYGWRAEVKLKLSLDETGTSRDPVHAFLRTRFLFALTNPARLSEFGVLMYDRNGRTGEAHEGRCFVKSWAQSGGKDQEIVDLVLKGQGRLTSITNPASSQVPVVTSLGSSGGATAGGDLVLIYGRHFTAATDVDFGATAADEFAVIHDGLITAVAPAHAGGSVQVKVTTAIGASADTAADNYLYA